MSTLLFIALGEPFVHHLQPLLAKAGHEALWRPDIPNGLETALDRLPGTVVCQPPDISGGEALRHGLDAREATANIPVIWVVGVEHQIRARSLLATGDDLLVAPVGVETLLPAVEMTLAEREAREREHQETHATLETLIQKAAALADANAAWRAGWRSRVRALADEPYPDLLARLARRDGTGGLESESRCGALLDSIGIGVYRGTADAQGKFVHANKALARMFGFETLSELMAQPIASLYEDSQERMAFVGEVRKHRSVRNKVLRMRRRDGQSFWVAVTAHAHFDEGHTLRWVEGILQDVSEQKQAEAALARERDLLWALMDSFPDQIYFKDTESKFTRINPTQARVLGVARPEDAVGKTDYDFFDHAAQAFADEQVVMNTRRPLVNKLEHIKTATGERRWVSSTKAPIVNQAGQVVGLVGITRDIHEAKLAEDALAQRTRLAALSAAAGDALIQAGSLRRILQHCAQAIVDHLNAAFARIWVLSEADQMLELQASAGMYTHLDGPHGRVRVGQLKIGRIALEQKPHLTNTVIGDPQVGDQEWAKREGMVAFAGYPLLLQDRLVGVLAMFARQPLSETILGSLHAVADTVALGIVRKQAEETLRQNEELFRLITENAADLIAVIDRQGHRLYHSPSFEKALGYSGDELRGMEPFAEIHPADRGRVAAAVALCVERGQAPRLELRLGRKDGEWRNFEFTSSLVRDAHGQPGNIVVVARDTTDRKRAEAQLEVASRQAGMAEVASSVLHNVGNVLNSVNTSANVIRDLARKFQTADVAKIADLLDQHRADLGSFLEADNRADQLIVYLRRLAEHLTDEQAALLSELKELTKAVDHIKDIVSMQQNYAKVSGVTERVQVADLVEEALRMHASALLRHDVQIVRDFAPDAPEITVERHKVLQVLVNLVHNAKQACDATGRGDKRLCVRTFKRDGGAGIEIADNGVGIPPENLTKIFSHGFTTRKDGHGFGLHSGALAAQEMGGALKVRSDGPGRGAAFTLELPLEPKEAKA